MKKNLRNLAQCNIKIFSGAKNFWGYRHCKYSIKWSYDLRSYEHNFYNCVEKPEKFRTSTGLEPVTSRLRCDALTNWGMKPLTLGAGHLWVLMVPWGMNQWWNGIRMVYNFIYHFTIKYSSCVFWGESFCTVFLYLFSNEGITLYSKYYASAWLPWCTAQGIARQSPIQQDSPLVDKLMGIGVFPWASLVQFVGKAMWPLKELLFLKTDLCKQNIFHSQWLQWALWENFRKSSLNRWMSCLFLLCCETSSSSSFHWLN